MVEWTITTVLKTVELKGSGGSNPSLTAISAKNNVKFIYRDFLVR